MHVGMVLGFFDELQKTKKASLAEHALEVGGLGLLAAPTAYKAITGKKVKDRTSHAAELGGLGVLAAHPAYSMAKHLIKRGSAEIGLVNAALSLFVKKSDLDIWDPGTGRVIGGEMGSRAANRGISAAGQAAKAVAKPKFTMDTLKSLYQKQGLKPALTSVLKRAH